MAWQRYAVTLKGEDGPVDVQTSAKDWAGLVLDATGGPKAMDMTFRVVHAALLRVGHEVPRDYDGFLEVLDAMPETVDEGDANLTDPTPAAPSDGSP